MFYSPVNPGRFNSDGSINLSNAKSWVEESLTAGQEFFPDRTIGVHYGRANAGLIEGKAGIFEAGIGAEITYGAGFSYGQSFLNQNRIQVDTSVTGAFLVGVGGLRPTPLHIDVENEKVHEVSFVFGNMSDIEGTSVSIEFGFTINGGTVGGGATIPLDEVDNVVAAIENELSGRNFNSATDKTYLRAKISEIFPDGSMITLKGGQVLGGGSGVAVGAEINVTGLGSTGIEALQRMREELREALSQCFVAGTMISMADGKSKPIEQISIGDLVLAFNEDGQETSGTVVRLFQNATREVVSLSFPDDQKELFVTPGHRFLDQTGSYTEIGKLIALSNGKPHLVDVNGDIVIANARSIEFSSDTAHLFEVADQMTSVVGLATQPAHLSEKGWQTYNFEVNTYHNYVANGIRVHNDSVHYFVVENGVPRNVEAPEGSEQLSDGTIVGPNGRVIVWKDSDGSYGETDEESFYTPEMLNNYGIVENGEARMTASGTARALADALGLDGNFGVDGSFNYADEGKQASGSSSSNTGSGSSGSSSSSSGSSFAPATSIRPVARGEDQDVGFIEALNDAGQDFYDAVVSVGNSVANFFGYGDPVILDLDGDGIEALVGQNVSFDMDGDGFKEQTSWASADDGFLIVDLNQNGIVDQTDELVLSRLTQNVDVLISFGNFPSVRSARILSTLSNEGMTDLQALALIGDNQAAGEVGRGVLNNQDTIWSYLKVWQDMNSNGISEAGEVKALSHADIGITEINLTYDDGTAYSDTSNDVNVLGVTLAGSASMVRHGTTVAGGVGDVSLTYGEIGTKRHETTNGHEIEVEGVDVRGKYLELSKSSSANATVSSDSYNGVYGDLRIPEHPAGHSGNIRPPKPVHLATFGAPC